MLVGGAPDQRKDRGLRVSQRDRPDAGHDLLHEHRIGQRQGRDGAGRAEHTEHLERRCHVILAQGLRRAAPVVVETVEGGPLDLHVMVIADERLFQCVGHVRLLELGERVRGRHDQGPRFASDRVDTDLRVGGRRLAEGDVDGLEPGACPALGEREVAEGEIGIRVGPGEGAHQFCRCHRRRGPDEADLEDAPFRAGERFGGPPDLAFAVNGRSCLCQEGFAGVRQRDAAARGVRAVAAPVRTPAGKWPVRAPAGP